MCSVQWGDYHAKRLQTVHCVVTGLSVCVVTVIWRSTLDTNQSITIVSTELHQVGQQTHTLHMDTDTVTDRHTALQRTDTHEDKRTHGTTANRHRRGQTDRQTDTWLPAQCCIRLVNRPTPCTWIRTQWQTDRHTALQQTDTHEDKRTHRQTDTWLPAQCCIR